MSEFFQNGEESAKLGADNLCPRDDGEIFGAYADADFMNKTKVLNGTNFFIFAPIPFQTYYWSIVKRNIEWYYGYVYGIHNKGVLSYQLASKICKMSAQLTLSGGFRFEGDETAERFLDAFYKRHNVEAKLKSKLPIHNAIGFTLAKIDITPGGGQDISFVQGNRYFAQTDDKGEVTKVYAVIKILTADKTINGEDANDELGYYLVEERFYKKVKIITNQGEKKKYVPVIRYRIYKGPIISTSPLYGTEDHNKGLNLSELPPHVQRYIVRRYGKNVLNKCFMLPFKRLGCVILLNSYAATGMEDYTCFSDSTIADIGSCLYEYDLTKTQKNEHKYLSQDFVALPESMIPFDKNMGGDERRAVMLENESVSGFNKRIVKKSRMLDPTKAVPFVYQSQLKTDIYNNDINQILNEAAAGAQFSPVTLAGFLHNGVERTATEVTADEDATRLTINDKRALISERMNKLNEELLILNGLTDKHGCPLDCSMVFNPGSLSNPKTELELLEKKQQNGWITAKSATILANPQLSRKAAEQEYEQAKVENGGNLYGGNKSIDDLLG